MSSLKELMGNAYKEGVTLEEVESFFSNNTKIVNLSNGGYVAKEKYEALATEVKTIKEETKDFETYKKELENYKSKETRDKHLEVAKKYIKDDFLDYAYFKAKSELEKAGKQVDEKELEATLKEFVKTNAQYSRVEEPKKEVKPLKVVSSGTDLNGGGQPPKTSNEIFNSGVRSILKKD